MAVQNDPVLSSPQTSDIETSDTTLGLDEFDLDLRFVESGPVVEELMRPTDDGCGRTCESACNSCP